MPKIAFVSDFDFGSYVCACVCPLSMLLISSSMIWTLFDWLNMFYSFYMAAVVIIGSGRGLRIEAHCRNQFKLLTL